MEFNLKYKSEVDSLRDEPNFEELGDLKFLNHLDVNARLYWVFARPSGSLGLQLKDRDVDVAIMAFNHSRLPALERFRILNPKVLERESLRVKIRNRARMLFRSLADGDFRELNSVLDLVPVFLPLAIDQIKNGRRWNEIDAKDEEVSRFLNRFEKIEDEELLKALFSKLRDISTLTPESIKVHIQTILNSKLDRRILKYYLDEVDRWLKSSSIHILKRVAIEKLRDRLSRECEVGAI